MGRQVWILVLDVPRGPPEFLGVYPVVSVLLPVPESVHCRVLFPPDPPTPARCRGGVGQTLWGNTVGRGGG